MNHERAGTILALYEAWCVTCDQRHNDQDRDAPPGKQIKVKWRRFSADAFGRMVPIARECYCCERVRYKFWADKNQKALNTLLEGDSNENDTHAEARRATGRRLLW